MVLNNALQMTKQKELFERGIWIAAVCEIVLLGFKLVIG